MSQRLINLVCIVITLVAAVYLYAFMNQYSSMLPEQRSAFAEDDLVVEKVRSPALKAEDDAGAVPVQNSRAHREEMLARMRSELRGSSTATVEAAAQSD